MRRLLPSHPSLQSAGARGVCRPAALTDFGVVVMVRVFVGLVIVGGRRLRHLAYVADDHHPQRWDWRERRLAGR